MEQEVKNSMQLMEFCHFLPKTELHAHLNGSIRRTTLIELLDDNGKEKIGDLYNQQRSFENCFKIFQISATILTSLDVISRITREMIEDWAKVNCVYLEIRTSLKSINKTTKEDYLWTVLNEINIGK